MSKKHKQLGKYTENEIVSIISQLMSNAQGQSDDEISNDRATALDFYYGDMDESMPVDEERSRVVSRDVLDAVETILPALIEMLTDADNAFEFKPVGVEDEAAARQETQVVRRVVFEDDNAYLNLYTFLKDALLSKTGILKVGWEESQWEREEYKNLTQPELDSLLNDVSMDIDVIDSSLNEDGTFDITIKTKRTAGKIVILPVPPEEFGIDQHATSPNPKDASFVYHRVKMTQSDLIQSGYDRELVEGLPFDDTITSAEQLARYRYNDEHFYGADNANASTRTTWITESYLYLDVNDDGIGELTKVTTAGNASEAGSGGGTMVFLDAEPVDTIPFVTATPYIRTHTFFGNSIADFVMDIQEVRTLMLRSVIDNTLQANNIRTAVNEEVNLDDMMTTRPGGVVRTLGSSPPSAHIYQLPAGQVPDAAYTLLEYMGERITQRTGASDTVAGLDADSLANVNTGVAMAALAKAQMKLKLIARNIAECGIKPLFLDVHALLQKHGSKDLAMKLGGEWITVRPQEWRDRTDMTVNVGIGRTSKMERLAMLSNTIQEQMTMLQAGLPIVNPQNLYETVSLKAEMIGIDPASAWTDPSTLPPPQPPQPDPMLQLQTDYNQNHFASEQAKLELAREKLNKESNVEIIKAQAIKEKAEIQEQSELKEAETAQAKMLMTAEFEREQEAHKQTNKMMDVVIEKQKLELAKYKVNLEALVKLMPEGTTLPEDLIHELSEEVIDEGHEGKKEDEHIDVIIIEEEYSKGYTTEAGSDEDIQKHKEGKEEK